MTGDHVREKLHSIRGWYPISIDVWIRDGFRCVYCDADLLATVDAYRYGWAHDHLIPRSISPDDSPSNIVLACSACNSFKRDFDPRDKSGADASRDALIAAARTKIEERRHTSELDLARVREITSWTPEPENGGAG